MHPKLSNDVAGTRHAFSQRPFEPLLVDVPTACMLLSVKKTKLFELLRPGGGLHRVKFGGKTLVTMASIRALAGQGDQ